MAWAIQSEKESALSGHRFFLLFVVLLATLVLFPYAEGSRLGSYAFRVIGSFTVVVSVFAARIHRSLLVFAIVLAIPALFERIMLPKVSANSFTLLNIVLNFVFDIVNRRGYFPPHVRFRRANLGNHLCGPLHLSASGLHFCQHLRNHSRVPAKRLLSGSEHEPSYRSRPLRFHLLQFRYHDFARRFWDYPGLLSGTLLFDPRSDPWRPVPCRADRKISSNLPPQVQGVSLSTGHST